MTIGQVAKQSGLAASTIRFYEQAGVLPKALRRAGRRHYDQSIFGRLAVLDRAKACGFTLAEIRQLLYGFREEISHSERWQTLARLKIVELDHQMLKIAARKELLLRPCRCSDVNQCGRRILQNRTVR